MVMFFLLISNSLYIWVHSNTLAITSKVTELTRLSREVSFLLSAISLSLSISPSARSLKVPVRPLKYLWANQLWLTCQVDATGRCSYWVAYKLLKAGSMTRRCLYQWSWCRTDTRPFPRNLEEVADSDCYRDSVDIAYTAQAVKVQLLLFSNYAHIQSKVLF